MIIYDNGRAFQIIESPLGYSIRAMGSKVDISKSYEKKLINKYLLDRKQAGRGRGIVKSQWSKPYLKK
jgi:hypothetical protein